MPILKRKTQVALALEAIEGTAETLTDADATMLVYDPDFSTDFSRFERDPARDTLSKLASVMGRKLASISWRTELKGSGDVTVSPSWGRALRACGFEEASVSSVAIGAVTGGPFVAGEKITTPGGFEGFVQGSVADGDALLRYIATTGDIANAEVITGGLSGATATASAGPSADQGFSYRPISAGVPSATVAIYQEGLKKQLVGARGTVTVANVNGEPSFLEFNFTGVYDAVTDEALLSPVYEPTIPPVFLDVKVNATGGSGCFANLGIDLGTTVTPRDCAKAANGAISVFITDRNPVGTVDPEMELVADRDFYGMLESGSPSSLYAEWGEVAGNTIILSGPYVIASDVGDGERDGIAVADLALEFRTPGVDTGDDELFIAMV